MLLGTSASFCSFKTITADNSTSVKKMKFINVTEPIMIRNFYQPFHKWTPSTLSSRLGGTLIGVAHPSYLILAEGKSEDKMTLRSYLNLFSKNSSKHLHQQSVSFSPLKKSSNLCKIFNKKRNKHLNKKMKSKKSLCMLSIGGKSNGLGLHRHGDAWLQLLFGRKHWVVFPPHYKPEGNDQDPVDAQKLVSSLLSTIDNNAVTKMNRTAMKTCTQQAGDLVYIPSNWRHGTYNDDEITIAVGIQMMERKNTKAKIPNDLEYILDEGTTLMYKCKSEAELKDNLKKLETLFNKAKKMNKYDMRSILILAELYTKTGLNKRARKEMLQAINLVSVMEDKFNVPPNLLSGWLYMIGYSLVLMREVEDAIPVLERLFNLSPRNTLIYVKSGILLLQMLYIKADTTPPNQQVARIKLFGKVENLLRDLENDFALPNSKHGSNDDETLSSHMTMEERNIYDYIHTQFNTHKKEDL
eukprot:g8659.t1